MFNNFLKTAFRSLWKNKGYSFLNIFGLAIGMACAGLIFLWVEDELSYDKFNEKKNNLYFVRENQKYDTYTATFGSTPGVMAPAMQAEIPGIANTCRMNDYDATLFTIGDKNMYAGGIYTDPSLFSMFTLPFIEGNARQPFAQRYSIVITQKTAKKFFGNEKKLVGKTVRLDNQQDYVVTGVIKDIPQHSSLQFEWAAPFDIIYEQSPFLQVWGNNSVTTYVELKPGTDVAAVNKKLYNFIQQRAPGSIARPFLWGMSQWHLYGEFDNGVATGRGQITYVRLFAIIAWIILLIACINFMNLATARSEQRAKEIGVRKVLGAGKQGLIGQFIGEAILMSLLSAVIAVAIMALVLPAFNLLVQKQLLVGFTQPSHIIGLVLITLVCGLVAGSYPSLYLSSFNPVFVLKGLKLKDGSAAFVRKGLVVMQFSISIVLIISTVLVYQQIQHVKCRNIGFDKNNLLEVEAQGEREKYYEVMKQDLLNSGMVESIALSDHTTLYGGNNTGGFTWAGKTQKAQVLISNRYVTPGFFHTSGMKLLGGRDFVQTDTLESKKMNVIITQSLEKMMGNESAVGKIITREGDTTGSQVVVVGVTNDYVYGNMYGKPDPVMFLGTSPQHANKMYVRINAKVKAEEALAKMEAVMRKYNPAFPFNYRFVDEQFNRMFQNEALIGKLSRVFATLAIIISCLGLFGLAAFTAERRTKEIGVRKVLGASVPGIALLVSKDFFKLVAISCMVAFPFAWWMMSGWLRNYQYRIEISWWIFLAAGVVAILIALVTVSFQAIKAAVANPVKSLRTE